MQAIRPHAEVLIDSKLQTSPGKSSSWQIMNNEHDREHDREPGTLGRAIWGSISCAKGGRACSVPREDPELWDRKRFMTPESQPPTHSRIRMYAYFLLPLSKAGQEKRKKRGGERNKKKVRRKPEEEKQKQNDAIV